MADSLPVSGKILQIMKRYPDCLLDELVLACEGFPWQEVLLGVHRLSEEGKVQLTPVSYGSCTVRLLRH